MGSSTMKVGLGHFDMGHHFTSTTFVVARTPPSVKTEGFLREDSENKLKNNPDLMKNLGYPTV